jgi:hypothetical protein
MGGIDSGIDDRNHRVHRSGRDLPSGLRADIFAGDSRRQRSRGLALIDETPGICQVRISGVAARAVHEVRLKAGDLASKLGTRRFSVGVKQRKATARAKNSE